MNQPQLPQQPRVASGIVMDHPQAPPGRRGPRTDFIVRRNFWGGRSPGSTRVFDKNMLGRFDYLVHCFKKRGIYLFLSHLSSRRVMPADGIPEHDKPVKAYRLSASGRRLGSVPVRKTSGGMVFEMCPSNGCRHYGRVGY